MSKQDFDSNDDFYGDDDFEAPVKSKSGKNNFLEDGVCEVCGNSGLAGDRCVCGGQFINIGDGLDEFETPDEEEPETYSLEEIEKAEDEVQEEE